MSPSHAELQTREHKFFFFPKKKSSFKVNVSSYQRSYKSL